MLGWLKGRSLRRRTGQQLYERIVAQSREPDLYLACRVPDTMDGRLEMVLLHTVLVLDRLQPEGAAGQRIGQHLMEQLVAGVDDALRRIGLGDDSVAPRIKRLAGALAERARDYREALHGASASASASDGATTSAADGPTLEAAFRNHVFGLEPQPTAAERSVAEHRLAAYVRRAQAHLAAMPAPAVLSGEISFPPVVEPDAGQLENRA